MNEEDIAQPGGAPATAAVSDDAVVVSLMPRLLEASKAQRAKLGESARLFSQHLAQEFRSKAAAICQEKPEVVPGKRAGQMAMELFALQQHNARIMKLNLLENECLNKIVEWMAAQHSSSPMVKKFARQMHALVESLRRRYGVSLKWALATERSFGTRLQDAD